MKSVFFIEPTEKTQALVIASYLDWLAQHGSGLANYERLAMRLKAAQLSILAQTESVDVEMIIKEFKIEDVAHKILNLIRNICMSRHDTDDGGWAIYKKLIYDQIAEESYGA